MNPIADVAKGAISGILSSAGDIISKFKKDPTKVAEFEAEMDQLKVTSELRLKELEGEIEQAYLKDVQSARDSNARIQESDSASWLAKNIGYVLDIVFTVAFFLMLSMILFKTVPEANKELFYIGFGSLGTYVSTIIGFHRGSSAGSKEKSEKLTKLMGK